MPVVRVDIRKGRTLAAKKALLDAIHAALVEAFKIPDTDRTQRIFEYAAEDFEIPPSKSENYTVVEITIFAGRSDEAKRRLYAAITRNLQTQGIAPTDAIILLHELPLANWGLRGLPATDVDLGFTVEV